MLDQLVVWIEDASPYLLYVGLGAGAAIENIVPLVPADTFVLLGGFFAARGLTSESTVFLVTWTSNVASALMVYWAAYHYGEPFFRTRLGRYLLDPKQVGIIRKFYRRWGAVAIFYTRFLPGLRSIAPVFAGLIRQSPLGVVAPLMVASAIWYGALVWIGAFTGRNVDQLLRIQGRLNWTLTGIAGVIITLLAYWWFQSRRRHSEDEDSEPEPGRQRDEPGPPSAPSSGPSHD